MDCAISAKEFDAVHFFLLLLQPAMLFAEQQHSDREFREFREFKEGVWHSIALTP